MTCRRIALLAALAALLGLACNKAPTPRYDPALDTRAARRDTYERRECVQPRRGKKTLFQCMEEVWSIK